MSTKTQKKLYPVNHENHFYKFITASVNEIFIFSFIFCSPDTYFFHDPHENEKKTPTPTEKWGFLLYFQSYIVHTRTCILKICRTKYPAT